MQYLEVKLEGDEMNIATQVFIWKNNDFLWKAIYQQLYDKIYPKKLPSFCDNCIIIGMDAANNIASFNSVLINGSKGCQFNLTKHISSSSSVSYMEYLSKNQL